jgi:hypothetical protein
MNLPEPYFDPVSQGICEVKQCSSPAKFRASWAQGTVVKLVCPAHKSTLDGKIFGDLSPTIFANTRRSG